MSEAKLIVPKGVVDEEAYNEFLQIEGLLNNSTSRFFATSDSNIVLDLCATSYTIGKKISHLPNEERGIILEKAREWRSTLGKHSILKRRAYGILKGAKNKGLGAANSKEAEILDLFGRFYKTTEVHKIILKDWGFEVPIHTVREYFKKNIEKITELQESYKQSHSDIRLGYKRSRLDELTWLYGNLKEKYNRNQLREDAKVLQSLLEAIKKEVEGDLVINGKLQVNVEQTVNVKIQQDMLKDFNISALIISKVSGRMNVNPQYLLSRLANSIYAKFTGFALPDKSREEDEIIYPSNVVYDLARIKEKNKQIITEDIDFKELPVVKEEEKPKIGSIRAKLLKNLADKKNKVKPKTKKK